MEGLKEKGFTEIKVVKDETQSTSQNRLVSSIVINDSEYISGKCYLPTNSFITIHYYYLKIKSGENAETLMKDKEYQELVENLEELGFNNIKLKRANDIGWFPLHEPEGSIKSMEINGTSDFKEDDVFNYEDEIIIIVHTRVDTGCEDITEIAE